MKEDNKLIHYCLIAWKITKAAYRSLLSNRLRSVLSTFGIIFGVASLIAMTSVAEGLKKQVISQIEELGAHNLIIKSGYSDTDSADNTWKDTLLFSDIERLKAGLNVEAAAGIIDVQALTPALTMKAEIIAVNDDYGKTKELSVKSGRFICRTDIVESAGIAVIGCEVCEELGPEGKPGEYIQIGNELFKIVGVLDTRKINTGKAGPVSIRDLNRTIIIPIGSAPSAGMKTVDNDRPALNQIVLKFPASTDISKAADVVRRILSNARRQRDGFQIIIPQELMQQAARARRTFNIVLGCITGISLLVGGIGIMNIMYANVSERTREIGIRRAAGASRNQILLQFLLEAIFISMAGAVSGFFLGTAAAEFIERYFNIITATTATAAAVAVITAVSVGIAAGIAPSIRAAKLNAAEALRT